MQQGAGGGGEGKNLAGTGGAAQADPWRRSVWKAMLQFQSC
jgi:hypothetical protein